MTNASRAVLVIEDDSEIRAVLRPALELEGYRVIEAATGARGLIEWQTHRPDLAIVDLGLPDCDGVEVIRKSRSWSRIPLVVLSARTQEEQIVAALEAGADDYITKPFGMRELLARLRVALRHGVRTPDGESVVLRIGRWRVDLEKREIRAEDGELLHLTPIEFRILEILCSHAGMVVTHRQLLQQAWGPGHVDQTHYLRGYMKQLRGKLEEDPSRPRHLLTETGVGYRLVMEE
jgi:two-component system, OmpR family, KDP operon response regulator KdpE